MSAGPYRIYALLAAAEPEPAVVGVLGVDERPVAVPKTYTAWGSAACATTQQWREGLASPPTPSQIAIWLEDDGAARMTEVPAPSLGRLTDIVQTVLLELHAGGPPQTHPRHGPA